MSSDRDVTATGQPHIVFFGHHKCGSRFFRKQVLAPLAEPNGYRTVEYRIENGPVSYSGLDHLDFAHVDFKALSRPEPAMLLLSNASQRVVGAVLRRESTIAGLHVIRDPRQVWVSSYFHHRDSHAVDSPMGWEWARLKRDRPILQNSSLEDGLAHELSSITNDLLANQLAPWRARESVLEVRLEDFRDVERSDHWRIQQVLDHLGLVDHGGPRALSHHANPSSRPWQEVLTPKLKAMFKQRFGLLLIDLGYESGFDW